MQRRDNKISVAVLVYVILLLGLQLFLLALAAEGFLADDPGLAWSATAVSAVLAGGAVLFSHFLTDRN